MGGKGSGRRPWYPGTLADCRALRVADVLHARRWRIPEGHEEPLEAVEVDGVPLALVVRPQPLGGRRAWWRCPGCACPCATLYRPPPGSGAWRCRRCLGWPYPSQREHALARAERRARRLASRLGHPWPWGMTPEDPVPPRPPRMHRRTYARLRAAWEEAATRCAVAWIERALRVAFR